MDLRISGRDRAAVRLAAILATYDLKEAGAELGSQAISVLLRASEPELSARDDAYESVIGATRRIFPGETAVECVDQIRARIAAAIQPIPNLSLETSAHAETQQLYTGMNVDVVCQTEPWITDPFQPFVGRARQSLMAAGWDNVPVRT